MIKAIIKEFLIILVFLAVILTIMVVLFYDYNPINKVVPNASAYVPPDDVETELKEVTTEETMINIEGKSYVIDGTDLNVYLKNNTYDPNKKNPFAIISESGDSSGTNGNNTSGGGSTKGGSSSGGSATRIK